MPTDVLIVPDKFKGTLTAHAAARAIAVGWRKARPKDRLTLLPMSDGGDGFGEVISALLKAKRQNIKTVDAAHRPCKTSWWWEPGTRTAIIESANVIGLAMLPPGTFHPFQLDTFGLGELLHAAIKKGVKRVIIGIGGSATNDGGFGLARSLGWRFYRRSGDEITQWIDLHSLTEICPPARPTFLSAGFGDFPVAALSPIKNRRQGFPINPQTGRSTLRSVEIIVAVDVQNPLLGPRGATRVYGPQKGIRPGDIAKAERCLRRLVQVGARTLLSIQGSPFGVPPSGRSEGRNCRLKTGLQTIPGAGAAGGLGFGLMTFAGARPENGFELFAKLSRLSLQLRAAALVITGEGMIDRSSLMGKGAGEIARRCRKLGIPCIGLSGSSDKSHGLNKLFTQVHALTDLTSAEQAKRRAGFWLERLAERAALEFKL